MRVAVDISLYPLDADFIPPIRDVIERLNRHAEIEIVTNPMATQLRGEYGTVMDALTQEIAVTFESIPKAVFAIKILNNPLGD
ncbi:MAG: YkoF family thiamine/hydroxymethylpyrimidine-binding protein [Woeseiaceae bacterium]